MRSSRGRIVVRSIVAVDTCFLLESFETRLSAQKYAGFMLTVKGSPGKNVGVDRRTATLVAAWLETYRSTNTRQAYERDVTTFVEWCASAGATALRAEPGDLDRYRDDALAAGASPATVNRRLSALASFFRFAATNGALTDNPADAVERPAQEDPTTSVLDAGELDSLLDAATSLGPKSAALVALLALDGMRLNEALAIDVPRVHVDGAVVAVEVRRPGGADAVQVDPRTAAAVATYLGRRRRGPLFLGESAVATSATRLSRFGADFLIKRAGASAGIDKPVSANVLRRSYIDGASRAGVPLADIAHHVGHREARETARLLDQAQPSARRAR
jgi:site-specific recombinase XerD